MSLTVSLESLHPLRAQLDAHPVYGAVHSLDDLRLFMSHHVFSVWDFMTLLKYLQNRLAPTTLPWAPVGHPTIRRFINDIVLEEESDLGLPTPSGEPTYASHFELYAQAMAEIGASPKGALDFAQTAAAQGFRNALHQHQETIPAASRHFMEETFSFLASDQPHVVAAAFALGREHIIPPMFRALLRQMAIDSSQAPVFHYYLERHIHLDEDHHGPLSLKMLHLLCANDPTHIAAAEEAARRAMTARIHFWDGVHQALLRRRVPPV
ncbi:MAG: DUF3050 domain-containing protein [Magnetococcales bacterium]|nr:DUF3050 domain-containing protein [Magnetococcales bacterium]